MPRRIRRRTPYEVQVPAGVEGGRSEERWFRIGEVGIEALAPERANQVSMPLTVPEARKGGAGYNNGGILRNQR